MIGAWSLGEEEKSTYLMVNHFLRQVPLSKSGWVPHSKNKKINKQIIKEKNPWSLVGMEVKVETVDLRGVRHDGYIIEIHSIRISEIIKILLKNNCMNVTEH